LLSKPNNNLGVEYIRALHALHSKTEPMTVLREGAAHNSTGQTARFVSATQIRVDISEGYWGAVQPYLIEGGRALLEGRTVAQSGLEQVERAIMARLRTMTAQDWEQLPDCGLAEGLPRRLERAGQACVSVDGFFEQAKTKRYTRARLSRLVLWAFLGLRAADIPARPPYIRVLGFNERGREVLRKMKECAELPIITKPAHARELDETGRRLFELEARCTDLYDLCFETIPTPGREWNTDPVILL
jgi:predicted nucleotidyltransferase